MCRTRFQSQKNEGERNGVFNTIAMGADGAAEMSFAAIAMGLVFPDTYPGNVQGEQGE